jgi:selenocysteine lyase/cysteine desulfurase
MRVGTPPILQLAALEAALDVWRDVDLNDLRSASQALMDQYIAGVEDACPDLILATPRDHALRGSQVSFRHPQAYAIMQAMIARGVVSYEPSTTIQIVAVAASRHAAIVVGAARRVGCSCPRGERFGDWSRDALGPLNRDRGPRWSD